LVQNSMKLGEAIYKASQAGAGAAGNSGSESTNTEQQSSTTDSSSSEKVVDAEYEEVKNEDKK